MTPDHLIEDEEWYWVKIKTEPDEWVVMQAQVFSEAKGCPQNIEWWEVMKDWATQHDEILIVGPKIEKPKL